MVLQDQEFNSEWDAQTLAEAKIIESDPGRLAAAGAAANKGITEAELKVASLKAIQKGVYTHPSSVAARDEREE